jgi:ferric-dicitrate binding protein FerR (iron transport regulator)
MKKEPIHISDTLLSKFLTDQVSNSEQKQIIEWLEISDKNQKHLDDLERVWLESGKLNPHPISVDKQKAWKKLSKRIQNHKQKNKFKKYHFISAIAASFLLLIGVLNWLSKPEQTLFTYQNDNNQVEKYELPDGSKIFMNQLAEVKYLSPSDRNTRKVKMKGEVFYQVHRDTSKAFIIDAGIGTIKVLGTSFNVKILANKDIQVSVNSGIVEIYHESSKSKKIQLKVGESGLISNLKKDVLKQVIHPTAFFWMNKKLIFQSRSLKEIFSILEKCYNVKIISKDENINKIHYSSNFMDNRIEEILQIISKTCEFEVNQENGNYIISSLQKPNSKQ